MRALLILAITTAAAHANPDDAVRTGPQPVPPLVLKQENDARGNVRGCPVGETCTRASDAMRDIDVELFPRGGGGNPWLDERSSPASRVEVTPARRVKRPSELRPEAAWLDRVEL